MKTVEFYTEIDDEDLYYPQLPDWSNEPVNDYVGGAYLTDDDKEPWLQSR